MERFIPKYTADGLRAVGEAIGISGYAFNMDWWAARTDCGTVMCIDGHFNLLRGQEPNLDCVSQYFGEEKLGPLDLFKKECGIELRDDHPGADERAWLFYKDQWPTDLREMYRKRPVLAAQLAIETYLDQYEIRESHESTAEQIADAIITDALVSR